METEKEGKELQIAPETQKLNWYVSVYPLSFYSKPTSSLSTNNPQPLHSNHINTCRKNRKLNTSPSALGEPDILKKPLCTPLVKKIDLHFPLGLEVTARNLKGVTIKDALDAIYKQFKKKVNPTTSLASQTVPPLNQ